MNTRPMLPLRGKKLVWMTGANARFGQKLACPAPHAFGSRNFGDSGVKGKRSGAASAIIALAMASADIRTGAGRPHMRAGSDAVTIKSTTRADGCDMRPGMHTPVAHTGTSAHHRSDMAACGNAMLANARTRTGTENMSARADTMLVDVHVSAHAQHVDAKIDRKGSWREQGHHQGHGANSGGKLFHSGKTFWSLGLNARQVRTFRETPFRDGEMTA